LSKIEVNTVEPQCGTTLTLGASGDTVALASGASQTGFGRTGTVDWITTPKTVTFTAVSGEGYFCNTTAAILTVNLPVGVAGSIVSLADYAATWQTNNVTVSPNGTEKIGSVNANVILSTEGQSVTLVYVDATQGWINTMDSTSNVRAASYMTATVSGACNAITTSGSYKIATFKGPGTFTVCTVASCAADNIVDYVVVAGGAAGGGTAPFSGTNGGGGGAGGVRFFANPIANPQSGPANPRNAPAGITVSATGFPITVGAGGAASLTAAPPGSDSIFSTITSTGGGGGGSSCSPTPPTEDGRPGGSGGGRTGGVGATNVGTGNTPPVSPSQGSDGGEPDGTAVGSGAGGGFITAGTGPRVGGAGGGFTGFGTTGQLCGGQYYFGGGGGSINLAGGVGGGGAGNPQTQSGTPGTINTGGGGGAGTYTDCTTGGGGGSGIIIIRYKFQ